MSVAYGTDYPDAPWVDRDGQVLTIDGAQLLDDVRTYLSRFVIYPSSYALDAHALWIAHTHLMDAWESTPRIAFLSPEPGSGKSRALEVTEPLVPRPVHAVNCTPAYLFRKVSDPDGRPTILYDEIDTVFGPKAKDNEDIRGMINAGHRRGAIAGRCVVRGKSVEIEELPAYCAVALAGLDDLPDTIMTRSIVIRMRRRAPSERVEPWRHRVNTPAAEALGRRVADWAADVADCVADNWPQMPESVTDRNADVWEPLVSIADQAGGHWPDTARVAAVALVADSSDKAQSLGVTLLRDVRTIFDNLDTQLLVSDQLLTNLKGLEEGPWGVLQRGEPITTRRLASLLKKYDIAPRSHRVDGQVLRGYTRAAFEDAWARYLDSPPQPENTATAATPATPPTFLPITGPDRCPDCGFHVPTQGHRNPCLSATAS